jgi:hypothetical protein
VECASRYFANFASSDFGIRSNATKGSKKVSKKAGSAGVAIGTRLSVIRKPNPTSFATSSGLSTGRGIATFCNASMYSVANNSASGLVKRLEVPSFRKRRMKFDISEY